MSRSRRKSRSVERRSKRRASRPRSASKSKTRRKGSRRTYRATLPDEVIDQIVANRLLKEHRRVHRQSSGRVSRRYRSPTERAAINERAAAINKRIEETNKVLVRFDFDALLLLDVSQNRTMPTVQTFTDPLLSSIEAELNLLFQIFQSLKRVSSSLDELERIRDTAVRHGAHKLSASIIPEGEAGLQNDIQEMIPLVKQRLSQVSTSINQFNSMADNKFIKLVVNFEALRIQTQNELRPDSGDGDDS